MGNLLEFTINAEGKKILNFDESNQYDDTKNGNRISDYEILQVLSQDNDINFVAKVRSLNNNKIYSIKKINLSNYQDQTIKDKFRALMDKLKLLNNPHIIKYYHYFEENNNLYILMEFMNNADISGYIQAHQILNKAIPEEEIWNILLQCLSALEYLHSQELGNMGVKLANIFMNNEQNVKIGVFRELNFTQNDFNPREDIYMLGKYFYAMMNSEMIKSEDIKQNNFFAQLNYKNVQNNTYSGPLIEIVDSMSIDNNSDVKVEELYEKVKKEYVKKYAKNSSIKAVLKCLYSYKILNDIILNKKAIIENNKQKYYIHYWYSQAIDAIAGIKEEDLNLCIEEFRRAIASSYSKLDGNKEVDPLLLLTFLLFRLHQEMNEVDNDNLSNLNKKNAKYVITSSFDGEEDKQNKDQMWNKFIVKYNSKVNSLISDLFFGFVKTKIICQTCRKPYYSFSNYFYIIFDLSDRDSKRDFDLIKDGFEIQFNKKRLILPDGPDRTYCDSCCSYQAFKEYNRYYMLRSNLIIIFNRGSNYKNKSKIIFDEKMNLEPFIEEGIDSHKNFFLVGCINRVGEMGKDERYSSYYRDPENTNYWHCDEYLDYSNVSIPIISEINKTQKKEQIIMLFYNSKDIPQ